LLSASSGVAMTACIGSATGMCGTVVSPAPRRWPRNRVEPVPTRRVWYEPDAMRAEPSAVEARREELVRPVDCCRIGEVVPLPGAGTGLPAAPSAEPVCAPQDAATAASALPVGLPPAGAPHTSQ